MKETPSYELYYWPFLQGRGEFIRLILEDTGTPYVDVARKPEEEGGGVAAIMSFRNGEQDGHPIFAPPILKVGDLVIAQTPNICRFLGERLGLIPEDENSRLYANQIILTINDLLVEVHDTHHPLGVTFYYEEQKEVAKEGAKIFHGERLPKLLNYFERILNYNQTNTLVGSEISYVDIMMFQMLEGLNYAFPQGFSQVAKNIPQLLKLREMVAERPNLKAYLQSTRRIPFNEDGIFRHYPELDFQV